MKQGLVRLLYNFGKRFMGWTLHMIMCVLLCYPVSIRIYYQQGVLFLVFSQYYILTFKIPAVKCHHGVEVNWSRYRDIGVTDPALCAIPAHFLTPAQKGSGYSSPMHCLGGGGHKPCWVFHSLNLCTDFHQIFRICLPQEKLQLIRI